MTQSTVEYTLHAPLSAVKLVSVPIEEKEHPVLSQIPNGSTIQFEGDIVLSGMVTIRWQDQRYGLFWDDLIERATLTETT